MSGTVAQPKTGEETMRLVTTLTNLILSQASGRLAQAEHVLGFSKAVISRAF